jgi:hypothetical protein
MEPEESPGELAFGAAVTYGGIGGVMISPAHLARLRDNA